MARAGFGGYQSYTVQKKQRELFLKIFRAFFVFYLVFLVIDGIFLKTLEINTTAMSPNITKSERVITLPFTYQPRIPFLPWALPGIRSPVKGDVVEMIPPYSQGDFPPAEFLKEFVRIFTLNQVHLFSPDPSWQNSRLVRRIIALPGDTVYLKNDTAFVKSQGGSFFLSEFESSDKIYYLGKVDRPAGWLETDPLSGFTVEIILGEDEYFVLADNREAEDSRSWGPVKKDRFTSLVWFTYWPFERMKFH